MRTTAMFSKGITRRTQAPIRPSTSWRSRVSEAISAISERTAAKDGESLEDRTEWMSKDRLAGFGSMEGQPIDSYTHVGTLLEWPTGVKRATPPPGTERT